MGESDQALQTIQKFYPYFDGNVPTKYPFGIPELNHLYNLTDGDEPWPQNGILISLANAIKAAVGNPSQSIQTIQHFYPKFDGNVPSEQPLPIPELNVMYNGFDHDKAWSVDKTLMELADEVVRTCVDPLRGEIEANHYQSIQTIQHFYPKFDGNIPSEQPLPISELNDIYNGFDHDKAWSAERTLVELADEVVRTCVGPLKGEIEPTIAPTALMPIVQTVPV